MDKCDIIIPVYNAPDYTKMCVYTLFKNTEEKTINKVYLLNDNSNQATHDLLENLAKKYGDKIVLIHNKENLGFIKNVNQGMKLCESEYVLLLNTDCFIGKNTIEKLMSHMKQNKKIGLICPLCSNAANLTLPMFPGFNYMMMDKLLDKKFKGINFDACTVVGNCLMISKECIKKVGLFDEIYGMGYGDETDYQFKAMKKGFQAKVAIDCYVFHKAEMSFNTTNQTRNERLEKNRKIFFDRWGDDYYQLLAEYEKNDPIEYVKSNLTEKDKEIHYDFMFVMEGVGNGVGGASIIFNLVNYLSILGLNIGILNLRGGNYHGIMNFNVLTAEDIDKVHAKFLISTIFRSVFFTRKLTEKLDAQMIYFSQGYEFLFENGKFYGEVESSFKLADYVITISDYLKNQYQKMFGIDAIKIENGIDTDQLIGKRIPKERKQLTMVIRPEALKACCIMVDIVKHITLNFENLDINLIMNDDSYSLGVNNNPTINIHQYKGPIPSTKMAEILKSTDILIDTSMSEGFGLVPLEAMASGAVPIVANAFGNLAYCKNEKNCIIINEINNTECYIQALKKLLDDEDLLKKYQKEAIKTAQNFDFDNVIEKYYQVLTGISNHQYEKIEQNITLKEVEKISNYAYSDQQFKDEITMCKKVVSKVNEESLPKKKQSRLQKLYIILKEFIKANLYLLKLLIKTIIRNDFEI